MNFELEFEKKIKEVLGDQDPAHDLLHVKRVVELTRKMALELNASLEVVIPAAWLHDLVNLSKDDPKRKLASTLSADEAILFLKSLNYEEKYFPDIHHAISAHSFSAQIKPQSLEAQIVQDADRLDALGAIGLARLFSVSTQLKRPYYNQADPFAMNRQLDDKLFAIDHIRIKLENIAKTMNTSWAQVEAIKRFSFIEDFMSQLQKEI